MNEELLALAEETQRTHAALIDRASRLTSSEARSEVRNDLLGLRSEFTASALALTGVEAPYLWSPSVPDHAVAIAIRGDIADTEERLARLAAGAALQKAIKTDFGYGMKFELPKGVAPVVAGLGAVGIGLIIVALLLKGRG